MKSNSFYLFVLLIILSCQSKKTITRNELVENINNLFASEEGTFAMAFNSLSAGEIITINAGEKFHAASTMKTPVLIEVYNQAAAGMFSLTDSMLVKNGA
ncbi:MAG: serine hydrolase [Bacteroidota bacterium]